MRYNYKNLRPYIFTEKGQIQFIKIRDNINELLKQSGAVMRTNIAISGDWEALACIDRLVELGELLEIPNTISGAGQHRLFISAFK